MNDELKQQCSELTEQIKSMLIDFQHKTGFIPIIESTDVSHLNKCGWDISIKVDLTLKY